MRTRAARRRVILSDDQEWNRGKNRGVCAEVGSGGANVSAHTNTLDTRSMLRVVMLGGSYA